MQDKSRLDPALVEEFVGNAHGNLDRVRDLLGRHETIVNAAWDWGDGDWETGLGAAAHMGQTRHRPVSCSSMGQGWISLPRPCSVTWKL